MLDVSIWWNGKDYWTTGIDYWTTGMDHWTTEMKYCFKNAGVLISAQTTALLVYSGAKLAE